MAVLSFSSVLAFAAGFDSIPLASGAEVLRTEDFSVGTSGNGGDLKVPRGGTLTLDYVVEPGRQVRLGVLTSAQFQQASSGHKIDGEPLLNVIIKGTGTQRLQLAAGDYSVLFLQVSGPVSVSYRASIKE
jgi:hypothetical protein